jgi:hypothetical protein
MSTQLPEKVAAAVAAYNYYEGSTEEKIVVAVMVYLGVGYILEGKLLGSLPIIVSDPVPLQPPKGEQFNTCVELGDYCIGQSLSKENLKHVYDFYNKNFQGSWQKATLSGRCKTIDYLFSGYVYQGAGVQMPGGWGAWQWDQGWSTYKFNMNFNGAPATFAMRQNAARIIKQKMRWTYNMLSAANQAEVDAWENA